MAKLLFKGIQQVKWATFNATTDKAGYIWFVRTPDAEATDNLLDDAYDIYFGDKHYGHFRQGEIEALAAALNSIKAAIGLDDDYAFSFEGKTTVSEAFALVKEWYDALAVRVSANETAITGVQDELAKMMVKNVSENDKVLTVADGILSAAIDLKYENNRISLYGKDAQEIAGFDASAFVKDSVLEDVKVDTIEGEKCIIFTWKVEGEGEPKTDTIKVSEFAQTYDAGVALELAADNKFNVKVAENANFLAVNANNELIVDDITTDKTMLKEAITIEGGPLASDAVKAAFANGVIPAGTDIQAVLKALLCVEIYPTPSVNTPSYSVSISAPTVSATDVTTDALVEVGQTIKFAAVTAKAVSVTKTEPKVSTFNHGYSATIDGDVNESTSVSGAWTVEQKANNVYELSAASTGFTGTLPTTVQNAAAASCTLAAVDLVAVEGTNKYSVTEDAPAFVGSHNGVASYYVVSNLGGRSEEHKSPAIEAVTDVEQDPANKTTTFTVTGVYPVYTNGVTASTTDATAAAMADLANPVAGDGTKLALMKASTSFAVSFANQGLEPYRLYLPGSWKVTSAMAINPTTAKYAVDCKAKFVANGTVTRTVQGKSVTYTVYEWASTEGPNRVKFTVA